ncbi:S26 family signal peptidase [Campylobacter concisus]|nr:S26 family signal peptidase [Campylobacter concisus]
MIDDNRNHSFDSRFFGAIPYKFLVGKVRWQIF